MREILFRGKGLRNNAWVYGFYGAEDGYSYIITGNDIGDWVEINPETLGQYTGLDDKNGVKIFEGDIVKTQGKTAKVFEVRFSGFSDGVFWIETNRGIRGIYRINRRCEVIGNIHDNPELLKN